MIQTTLFLAGGALIGAAVGNSQVLCTTGQCIFLGTWYGGALLGGGLGLIAADLWRSRSYRATPPDDDGQSDATG